MNTVTVKGVCLFYPPLCKVSVVLSECCKQAEMSVVTGLDIIYGKNSPAPPGYSKIPADLNKGAGGEYIYLCYSTASGLGQPITGIQVFASDRSDFVIQNGYTKIQKDLNKGARGKFIYVCFTRDTMFPPIAEVGVIQSPKSTVYPGSLEWVRINQDCSHGANGEFTYIMYKRVNIVQQYELKVNEVLKKARGEAEVKIKEIKDTANKSVRAAEEKLKEVEQKLKEAEQKASEAELKVRESELKVREAEFKAREAEMKAREAELKSK